MAVVSGVTVVPNARIAGVALTGLDGDKAVAAMGKTLEREGGKRVLRKQERGRAHKSDEPLFHTFPHASMRRLRTIRVNGSRCGTGRRSYGSISEKRLKGADGEL
jgi:hypothetical protein